MARTKPRKSDGTLHDEEDVLSVAPLQPTARHPNTDVTREKTVIKEREVIHDGPDGHHKEKETEDVIERDMVTAPDAANIALPPSVASSGGGGVKINPRTGKPLSMPKPLSLSPRDMSPIFPVPDVPPGSQMIREEHEEVGRCLTTSEAIDDADHTETQRRTTCPYAYHSSNLCHSRWDAHDGGRSCWYCSCCP